MSKSAHKSIAQYIVVGTATIFSHILQKSVDEIEAIARKSSS